MKTLFAIIITLFSHLAFANEWKHIYQKIQGYEVRLSYTLEWSPATYGSHGGNHEGIFYVDLYSQFPSRADSVEIIEIKPEGRLETISSFDFKEDHSRHFYGRKNKATTYADFIWAGKNYKFRVYVDGKVLEGKFRI